MLCWHRWRVNRKRSWDRRSTVSFRLVCYFGRERHRMRPICSSMRSCRMPPMARDCPEIGGSSRLRQLWAWRGDWIEHTTEPGAEHAVVDRAADLKKQIGASPRPSHLLRFIHSPVDQEIRGTFGN